MTQFPEDSTNPTPEVPTQKSLTPEMPTPTPPTANWRVELVRWLALLVGLVVLHHFKPELVNAGIAFVITLSVLVFVHEWGHFQFARWAGMKVNRFAIGFPPFIYTKRVKGIDYSIGALPIGGMVDIAGLGSEEEMVATTKGEPLQAAPRNSSTRFGEKNFQDASLGWRFMALFAGPLMNFIYALIVFVGVYTAVGLPNPVYSGKVESVSEGTPAAKAGILANDKIVGVDSAKMANAKQIREAISNSKSGTIALLIERNGQTIQKTVAPIMKDINGDGKKTPFLGVQFDSNPLAITYEKTDVLNAVKLGFLQSAGISLQILDTLKRAVTRSLTKDEVKGIGGPVKIAQVTADIAQKGFVASLLFSAMLSVNLGLMNLLPFPALDGGRIMFLGYELVARKPIDARKEGLAHTVGIVMLLAFMLFITARDIWPYITKHLSGS